MQMEGLLNFITWVIAFWVVLMIIGKMFPSLEKHGLFIGPFYAIWKTTRLNPIFTKVAMKWRIAWKVLFDIGIALGIGQMIFAYYWLLKNLLAFLKATGEASPVYPVIPGLTIGLETIKYFVPAILVIFITHEFAHGIAARMSGVRIRSVGALAAFLVFAAFVEPDEQELKQLSVRDKLRMFSAGSMANLATALLIIGIISVLFLATPQGVLVMDTLKGYPAEGKVPPYSVIVALNETEITSIRDLAAYLSQTKPGDVVVIRFVDPDGMLRGVRLKLAPNPENKSRGFLGVRIVNYMPTRIRMSPLASLELLNLLSWIQMLCLSAAVLNMLPIYPFDGGRVIFTLIDMKLSGKGARDLVKGVIMGTALLLLVLNMALSMFKFPLIPI